MPDNQLILLNRLLEQRQADDARGLSEDQLFERFAVEQALQPFDINPDEIEVGIVGGGNDGGLDAVYPYLAGQLLAEDSDVFLDNFSPASIARGTRLSLQLVQAKTEQSFTETALDLVSSSTERLLDLGADAEHLRELYNDAVVDRMELFTRALSILAVRHPVVEVTFHYVSKGDITVVNRKVSRKAEDLQDALSEVVPGATGKVQLVGAAELWHLASTPVSYTLEMAFQENATSGNSHVALVSLSDYFDFLSTDEGMLRRHIFDWNVRDFQGAVEVNQEIQGSLAPTDPIEFWWLNNGVTIICSRASSVGKRYILDDVQVVNGLQTSQSIFNVLRGIEPQDRARDRSILVRILVTADPTIRDRVIRATNRQTSVSDASLRATDEIQRDIEAYFVGEGLYYDRRKNYYRNLGKSPDRIISIPVLAQSVMAMGLSRPDNSRARPSSLLKRDDTYEQVFSTKIGLPVYLWCAQSQKKVDAFLQGADANASAPERTNLRWHLSMLAAGHLLGTRLHAPAQLQGVLAEGIEVADLPARLAELRSWYKEYLTTQGGTQDKAAKSNEFVEFILQKQFGP